MCEIGLTEAKYLIAEVDLYRQQLAEARVAATEALALAQSVGIQQTETNALRVLEPLNESTASGICLRTHPTESLKISADTTSPFDSARAEFELGLLYMDKGDQHEARTHLEESLKCLNDSERRIMHAAHRKCCTPLFRSG